MNVYHGSNVIVHNPDVVHSFRQSDFGKGFYVTTVKVIDQLLRYKTFYEVMRYE